MRDPLISEGSMDIGKAPEPAVDAQIEPTHRPVEDLRERARRKIAEDEATAVVVSAQQFQDLKDGKNEDWSVPPKCDVVVVPGPTERMAIDGLAKWSDKMCDELFVKHVGIEQSADDGYRAWRDDIHAAMKVAVDHAPVGDQTVGWTQYVQPTDTLRIKIDARPVPSLQAYFDQLRKEQHEIGLDFHNYAKSAMNPEAQSVINRVRSEQMHSMEQRRVYGGPCYGCGKVEFHEENCPGFGDAPKHDAFSPPRRQYAQPLDLDDVEVGAVRAKAFELAIKQSIKTVEQISHAQSVENLIGSARMIEEYLLNG